MFSLLGYFFCTFDTLFIVYPIKIIYYQKFHLSTKLPMGTIKYTGFEHNILIRYIETRLVLPQAFVFFFEHVIDAFSYTDKMKE